MQVSYPGKVLYSMVLFLASLEKFSLGNMLFPTWNLPVELSQSLKMILCIVCKGDARTKFYVWTSSKSPIFLMFIVSIINISLSF